MKMHALYEDLLGNKTKITILRTLFEYPDKTFSEHELSRFTHVPQPTIHRNMGDLVNSNLVVFNRMGKMNLFSLNRNSVMYTAVKQFLQAEKDLLAELENVIVRALEQEKDVLAVNLYGSFARGSERSDSDVDIIVIVCNNADILTINERLEELGRLVHRRFGNTLSYTVKRIKELKEVRSKQIYGEIKKGRNLITRKGFQW
jgi:predicted nucleotidyltransferase